jgi:hypothetical protein
MHKYHLVHVPNFSKHSSTSWKKPKKTYDDIEHKAKENLPNADYRCVNAWKRAGKENVGDGDASNADETFSPRDSFWGKSFISIMDVLETNFNGSVMYVNVNIFLFWFDFDA